MELQNERELLSIIRGTVMCDNNAQRRFQEFFSPLFDSFIEAGKDVDEYAGYTFGLKFIKSGHSDYERFQDALSVDSSDWFFSSEGKDDCTCVVPGKGIIKVHLFSFLWNL